MYLSYKIISHPKIFRKDLFPEVKLVKLCIQLSPSFTTQTFVVSLVIQESNSLWIYKLFKVICFSVEIFNNSNSQLNFLYPLSGRSTSEDFYPNITFSTVRLYTVSFIVFILFSSFLCLITVLIFTLFLVLSILFVGFLDQEYICLLCVDGITRLRLFLIGSLVRSLL